MNSTAEIILQQGKYRINHTLDRGEFGITYRATHVQLGQAVAIKTLRPSLRHHPDFAQYYHHFRNVIHRLSQCQHPHLVRVLDVFEEKGLPFVVMNYIEGCSLAHQNQSRAPLAVDQALHYVSQMAAVLKVIHSQGLLHCHIQPQAILQRSGSNGVILVDFGINSSFIEPTTQPYRGNRNLPGGFTALEQYLPHETLTPATDIYGIAATLYYLLTGIPPLEAPLLSSQGTAQWFSQVQPTLKRLHPDLSPSVEHLILAGLEVQQSNRPQTIDRWLAFMPDFNSHPTSVESYDVSREDAISTDSNTETVPDALPISRSRFLMQFLWLRRCTPVIFVITALLFGWLGFSVTRRYTQMVFHDVHQKFGSGNKGADWSDAGFSDYDPSKPMFEDPDVKTREIEPDVESDEWDNEWDSDTDFDESDSAYPADGYNSASEWDEAENYNDRSDYSGPGRYDDYNSQPDYSDRPTELEQDYGWESEEAYDNTYERNNNTDEWGTAEANTWESESNSQLDNSQNTSSYDYRYQYDYNREVNPNQNNSEYSGYTSDRPPSNGYSSESRSRSEDNPSTPDWQPSQPYSSQDYSSQTDWDSIPPRSYNPYNSPDTYSDWTADPSVVPESSRQRIPASGQYNQYDTDPAVELSIPESSQSFSEYENDSTVSQSNLGLEEIPIPTPVRSDNY
ncbi:MAG: serine/threonine-protein kinase [Microcoleaceae cyanobacterium]